MRLHYIIDGFNRTNDDELSRPLLESILAPEVTSAAKTWIGSTKLPGVLIGGLALSFYTKPRYTADVDILYVTDQEIPEQLPGFKRTRPHSFQHNQTHVEIEVLSANYLGLPIEMVQHVVQTAIESNGMKIASPSALVALKLFRGNRQDQADIEQLIQTGKVDLTPFGQWLSSEQLEMFKEIEGSVQ